MNRSPRIKGELIKADILIMSVTFLKLKCNTIFW